MDTLKEYILMCEKAVEIQKLFKFKEGDFYIDDMYRKKGFVEVSNGGWTAYEEKNFKGVWLPRQDQLQGMVSNKLDLLGMMQRFNAFCDLPHETNPEYRPLTIFISMEQLWLAFVMLEKFNKLWNGKEWIQTNQ